MWPFLVSGLALALILLHLWWLRRHRQARRTILKLKADRRDSEERRRQMESQARAQEEALFNSMIEGVLILDGNGRIQLANRALEKLFATTTDLRGKTLMETLRIHTLPELVNRLAKEGTVDGLELELPGLDKRLLQVNATAVLDSKGQRQGSILVFHDLTRLKQLENTRQEFVANVSHELRTPLSLIKGYVETLLEGAREDPAVAVRFLQTIDKHADRLTYLIEDLLTISRLESGQIVLNLHPVELRPIAGRVIDDLQARAAERSVTLFNRVPEGLMAHADADRLQQVLFNLVDNAIKYGRTPGQVTLGGVRTEDHLIEMTVQDDGPGIPQESLTRVFERFYRVDKARSREQGGTGLGLSIVKHIVQSHRGEVWAESEPGKGTTFHFTLPEARKV
ncbi:MAG TPA: ATP-binding protein [Methylomirabilota bacterium]|nr:ATP-binding protein [Methylomirabilota bacterium]